ncbi:MAG: hypothetical protein KC910_09620 [Candidatus Eremiobacteraeota bacterium]|nr:hypothetical protein [Candidatus Eremiobacteraeota bacterium]
MSRPQVVILGAGRPFRGESPSALVATPDKRRVLDWILDALAELPEPEIHYVAGYGLEALLEAFPSIGFSLNPQWRTSGSLVSLLSAPLRVDTEVYVCYADTLFDRQAVQRLRAGSGAVTVGLDLAWRRRYPARPTADIERAEKVRLQASKVTAAGIDLPQAEAEFTGLMRLSPEAVRTALAWSAAAPRAGLPDLINHLIGSGLEVEGVDLGQGWAELNVPQDMARFVLGTKAETLRRLAPLVRHSHIGPQVTFTLEHWSRNSNDVLERISGRLGEGLLAVRSSAVGEDGWEHSMAGEFTSRLNVPGRDRQALTQAIEEVRVSYGESNPSHQILVQPMVEGVSLSGVVLTRTLSCGAPYYTFNYDASSQRTDSVTGGGEQELVTYLSSRSLEQTARRQLAPVMAAVRELEELVGYDTLDIEFAMTEDQRVHVLQLRPLAAVERVTRVADDRIYQALDLARRRFEECQGPRPGMVGEATVFGVMPDWNPAEIIGTRPDPLARTLYQYLITDEIWARQRAEYGYRDPRPTPLLVSFAGHPYIDVRASLNSFLPAGLEDRIGTHLVGEQLARLRAHPQFHDKLEFELAHTCWTFDFPTRPTGLTPADEAQLEGGLLAITRQAFGRLAGDLACLDQPVVAAGPPLERAYRLLYGCRQGALVFAHLARAGFVAVSLLRSLVRLELLSPDQAECFMNSLETVVRRFESDGARVQAGEMSFEQLVERYGHLRPGTYDITSAAYRDDPDFYLRPAVRAAHWERTHFEWPHSSRWTGHLERLGTDLSGLERFLRGAIEGREFSKFVFTRALSQALDELVSFGSQLGFERQDVAMLRLDQLFGLLTSAPASDLKARLTDQIERGRLDAEVCRAVELPALLCEPGDLFEFELLASQPNFVSRQRVSAAVTLIEGDRAYDLKDRIVLIPSADPGFDWLFSHAPAGLVTMYGGANSHMAIRAAELGLPAAIGVGQADFERYARARVLELDCSNHRIKVLH